MFEIAKDYIAFAQGEELCTRDAFLPI